MENTFRRGVALVLLVMMTACSTMQPVAQPRDFLLTRQPAVIWLSKSSDQTMVAVDAPKLLGDSIVGFVEGDYVEIPIKDVKSMQARQYSRSRTTAFLLGAGALAVGLALIVTGGLGSNSDMIDEDDIGIIRFGR
jgi:hypothetical protein